MKAVEEEDRSRLLLVEDDPAFRGALARALANRGYAVTAVATRAEARQAATESPPAFVVCDLRLPDGSGLDFLDELSALAPRARSVVLTGWGSIPAALRAVRAGAVDFLAKPAGVEEVLAALEQRRPTAEASLPTLHRVEWEHIQRVLDDCRGNVSQAARVLGLDRRSLQRKLAKRPPSR